MSKIVKGYYENVKIKNHLAKAIYRTFCPIYTGKIA